MHDVSHTVYLGLGANLGRRRANLAQALRLLDTRLAVERVSSCYETEPVGYTEQPLFVNIACRGATNLSPQALLRFVKSIEKQMGRRPSFRNAPRPIDVDILLYGDLTLEDTNLTIPHPRLAERAFVLAPLAEIAPALQHPVLGQTMSELLAQVDQSGVWPIACDLARPSPEG